MPTLDLHHYKNHKQPYVAKIIRDADTTKREFLPKTPVKKSSDGTFGDYQVTVDQPGLYQVGNAQSDENGYRLFFKTSQGNRFPFIRKPEDIENIKARIARGEEISTIAAALGL